MRVSIPGLAVASGAALFVASAAFANTVNVSNDIAVSTTWTKNNVYNLTKQIYVLPGATLTIEPGTVIASTPTANGSGSLAITRGAKIIAKGTRQNPIIFTSSADVATWTPDASHPTGRNPKTGVWRESANEWGNLTIMGRAFISNGPGSQNFIAGNVATPNANNVSAMEGLIAAFPGDPNVLYGGGDDNDDSGILEYVSIRYAGRVVGLGNELNGISLGGIGRGTKIEHLEIMNNVDDGIEIWGGTVNIKYFTVWNIGDDSFDVDQGWRGKAQFGLIVQGHSLDAPQGSGVGDNLFETDGAENSDSQPVTTATIYNVTAIGQPAPGAGDHGTAFRDNARVQYRQSIFMDLGDRAVSFDNVDGDGGQGYGFNGTLSWANTWTTDWNVFSTVNAPANPAAFYTAQSNGKLIDFRDNVFFRNLAANAYTEANNRGVFAPANNNVLVPGFADADRPIVNLVRGGPVTRGGLTMLPVTAINPRAANAALTALETAPNDGFFTPVTFRGAVGTGANANWLCDWTAARAFGFVTGQCPAPVLCPADLNGNGSVGAEDLSILLGAWGGTGAADLNGNGSVGAEDLSILLGAWGACPS